MVCRMIPIEVHPSYADGACYRSYAGLLYGDTYRPYRDDAFVAEMACRQAAFITLPASAVEGGTVVPAVVLPVDRCPGSQSECSSEESMNNTVLLIVHPSDAHGYCLRLDGRLLSKTYHSVREGQPHEAAKEAVLEEARRLGVMRPWTGQVVPVAKLVVNHEEATSA